MAIDQVTTGLIKDDAVTADKIVAGAVVADIAAGGVTTAKLAADAVDGTKLADNAVNSEHYTDGSIDLAHLSADSVDGTKIVDDAINSEHYAAGSIDTAHIADDQVTGAKIENNPTIAGNLTVAGDVIPSTPLSHRNMIINGAMQINQRYSSSGTKGAGQTSTSGYKGADRFETRNSGTGSWQIIYSTEDLSTAGPNGIRNSFKIAFDPNYNVASPAADANLYMRTMLEAQDLQHLQYGTASAKAVTLSFYVRSNMNTGGANTFSLSARTPDGTDRNIGTTYTVANSNWNRYTWTIPGDASGQIDNNNDRGMIIMWKLIAGSNFTSVANTSWAAHANNRDATGHTANLQSVDGQYWEITGVQLELGSNATPFEHRSYGDDLLKCQRYFEKSYNRDRTPGTSGGDQAQGMLAYREGYSGNARRDIAIRFKVDKRALPTMTAYAPNGTSGKVNSPNGPNTTTATFTDTGNSGSILYAQPTSGSYYQCHYTAESEL